MSESESAEERWRQGRGKRRLETQVNRVSPPPMGGGKRRKTMSRTATAATDGQGAQDAKEKKDGFATLMGGKGKQKGGGGDVGVVVDDDSISPKEYCDVPPRRDEHGNVIWPAPEGDIERARDFLREWWVCQFSVSSVCWLISKDAVADIDQCNAAI